jgi:hypothetical protein
MKRVFLLLLFMGFMVGNAYATTTLMSSGNWNDTTIWSSDPNLPYVDQDVKTTGGDDLSVIVNDARQDFQKKLAIARGATVEIQTGGSISFADDIKVGDAGASSSGTDVGYLEITGGTLTAGDRIAVGYQGGSMASEGYMTVSGGTVNITGGGGLKIGCENGDGAYGYLGVIGDGGSINVTDRVLIANDSTGGSGDIGHAVVEFELNSTGDVSRVVCEYVGIDSQNEVDALAELLVTVTGSVQAADIVLFESTSTSSTVGEFDSLNGGSAAEGAYVQLGTEWFQLTYQADVNGDSENNDIVLVLVPEPATLALLALGGLIVAKRKRR